MRLQSGRINALPVLVLALLAQLACGPLGPIPGGRLRGAEHEGPAPAWDRFAQVEQVQLETNPEDPHSVNTWIGVYEGALYIPTSLIRGADDPRERTWVKNVQADPKVRLRIDDTVYPLRATQVEDPATVEAVRSMLLSKYEVESDPHAQAAWIFRLDPR